jgi:hypothetical protein
MYFSHHLWWEHGIGGEKSPPLLCLFFTVCLVNLVKVWNAQLPRKSRETIPCSATSSVSWNYPMLSCLVNFMNYSMLRCLVSFLKLPDAQLPRQLSWNYPMLSCLINLVKLSDAEPKESALPRAHCKDTIIPRNETARPRSQFLHSCICEQFIYSHFPQSVCIFCCRKIGGLLLSERDQTWKELLSKWWKFEWIQCFKLLSYYSNIFFRAALYIYLFILFI